MVFQEITEARIGPNILKRLIRLFSDASPRTVCATELGPMPRRCEAKFHCFAGGVWRTMRGNGRESCRGSNVGGKASGSRMHKPWVGEIMTIIVSKGGLGATRVGVSGVPEEGFLQKYVANNPESLPFTDIRENLKLLVIAREFDTRSGQIDVLAADDEGDIYIIETKLFGAVEGGALLQREPLNHGARASGAERARHTNGPASCAETRGDTREAHMTRVPDTRRVRPDRPLGGRGPGWRSRCGDDAVPAPSAPTAREARECAGRASQVLTLRPEGRKILRKVIFETALRRILASV
jgi:hypothetical protein